MSRSQKSKALALGLAATVAFAMIAAAPAGAADAAISPAGVAGKPLAAIGSRHHVARIRTALWHHFRPMQAELGCAGAWCGRQFVLMVGIGY